MEVFIFHHVDLSLKYCLNCCLLKLYTKKNKSILTVLLQHECGIGQNDQFSDSIWNNDTNFELCIFSANQIYSLSTYFLRIIEHNKDKKQL